MTLLRKKLAWRVYVYFLLSTAAALALVGRYASRAVKTFHENQAVIELTLRAELVAKELGTETDNPTPAFASRLCEEWGRLLASRLTIVLPDGVVIGDTDESPAVMDNHGRRPEILAALNGGTGQSVRHSDTLRRRFMYVAVPVRSGGAIVAVARASKPLDAIDAALRTVYLHILAGVLGVAVVFAGVAFYFSRRIGRPLEDMQRVAGRLAQGDLTARVAESDGEEIGALARSLNQMAIQLQERLGTIEAQRNEQDAVLASMVEGVLAVDKEERIVQLNAAAARLLGVRAETALGRSIQEAVRNTELQKLIGATLAAGGSVEGEIALRGEEEQILQVQGTTLTDASGAERGALMVLHDITRLKRLENVRRDFVANVSHELKTPITALKGCVETLAEGAMERPDEARPFLQMMSRQTERLAALVEDLLSLSRIEADTERSRVRLERAPVHEPLKLAVQAYAKTAETKGISLVLDCPENLEASLNAPLLEQAVGNLVDNALKYSPEGKRITVRAVVVESGIEIQVQDEGCGIEKKHLPRIFERFYRVDQARSRALGGTGLGLAIVKHIALAHNGTVGVASTPGAGSTFTIRIEAIRGQETACAPGAESVTVPAKREEPSYDRNQR